MILIFRPIKVWPEGWTGYRNRPTSPFAATYTATLQLLDRELHMLGATGVTMQVDVSERDVRLDGQLRADARPSHPGVILTIDTRKHGTLIYATDRFSHWQANLRAIALGLEALRKVERYGIAERGQQYAGYRELGTGIALGAAMTLADAAQLLADEGGQVGADDLLFEHEGGCRDWIDDSYRMAAKKHHPDAGGDPGMFRRLTEARDLLVGAS